MVFQDALLNSFRTHADRIAIESADHSISYAELAGMAERISDFLTSEKVEHETVGILVDDRVALIAAIIGVACARCVYVPLDGSLPASRLQAIAEDLDLDYLLVSHSVKQQPWMEAIPQVVYWEDLPVAAAPAVPAARPDWSASDSLYIYFTSGSTGRPKGIVGSNAGLLQFLEWEIDAFGIDQHCRVSQLISPYFDAFLRDVFVPLLTGGTICLPPAADDFLSPEKLVGWIDNARISFIHCVPSVFRLFNSELLTSGHFRHLQYVLLSGEKIIPATLTNWYKTFGDRIQLVNLYGATETTMIRFYYKIQPADAGQAKIPVGLPIAATSFQILKENGKPCDALIPGELYIVSDHMTQGYLNAPELTHQRFVTLGAGPSVGRRAFKTGDMARRLNNGLVDLLGREDRQIKLRGIRIEPDEIEQAIIRSGFVAHALVVLAGEDAEASLVAFVTPQHADHADTAIQERIKAYVEQYLPTYMVPAVITVVAAFPLLANGKVDHKKLLDLLVIEKITPPANETEVRVLTIWKEILGNKPVSTEESFIRAGGNSLGTMRLMGRIFKEFNVRISLSELFNNLTVRQQAALIARSHKDAAALISPAPVQKDYPLSSAQERIYFMYEQDRQGTVFNLPMAWQLDAPADRHRLATAISLLVERHESLRTEFHMTDGRLAQSVLPAVDCSIEEIAAPASELTAAMQAFVRPFDLAKAPLIRCGLISTGGNKEVLIVDIHHIVCDGMSQQLLFSDFLRLYNGETLQPLRITYKDYATWENNFKLSPAYLACREFWLQSFAGGIPAPGLPVMREGLSGTSHKGGAVNLYVERDEIVSLTNALKGAEVTNFSGLFGIYSLFLLQLTGREDLLTGVITSGRTQDEVGEVVGMFAKVLPVRYRVDMTLTVLQWIQQLHQYLAEATSKQMYDLTHMLSDLNGHGVDPEHGLFETAFSFQHVHTRKYQSGNEAFAMLALEDRGAKYPLTLLVEAGDDGAYLFRFEYLQDYFTAADMELLSGQFRTLLLKSAVNMEAGIMELLAGDEQAAHATANDVSFSF